MSRTAIFIDGAYLDKTLQHDFGSARLDMGQLPAKLAGDGEILRTYYYDCPPYQSDPPTEEERRRYAAKNRYFNFLERLPRCSVRLGKLAYRGRRDDGRALFVQKRVDIMLGVDMVTLAFRDHIGCAVLLAGDSDFLPAVEVAKQNGVLVKLFHGSTCHRELWNACDERTKLDEEFVNALRR